MASVAPEALRVEDINAYFENLPSFHIRRRLIQNQPSPRRHPSKPKRTEPLRPHWKPARHRQVQTPGRTVTVLCRRRTPGPGVSTDRREFWPMNWVRDNENTKASL